MEKRNDKKTPLAGWSGYIALTKALRRQGYCSSCFPVYEIDKELNMKKVNVFAFRDKGYEIITL